MRPGEPWGSPLPPGIEAVAVAGVDADLAAAAGANPDAVYRFAPAPGSDLARTLGLAGGGDTDRNTVVPCDLLDLGAGRVAVNAVVLGVAPDRLRAWHRAHPVVVEVDGRTVLHARATSVVVANGQFLRGNDLAPRGHPGDGRAEIQVYRLRPRERTAMRDRLTVGDHVPHPRILQTAGRRVTVAWEGRRVPVEADGRPLAAVEVLTVEVRPGAARLLI